MKYLKSKTTIAIFIVVLLTFSCKEKKRFNSEKSEQFNEEYLYLDLDHCSRASNLRMSSLFSSVKLIPLQITDNSIIGKHSVKYVFNFKFS